VRFPSLFSEGKNQRQENQMNIYLTIIISLLSVAVGAGLQFIFTRMNFMHQKLMERESQAYVDYLKAVALLAKAHYLKDEKISFEATTAVIDAKSRICVFGHDEVANALSKSEKLGANLVNDEQRKSYVSLVQNMRNRSCKFKILPGEIIEKNLFQQP
jgi:hypothetical protein